ncbi:MAG: BatA and WFA domain-containing protein [Armatimonadota bacterium]
MGLLSPISILIFVPLAAAVILLYLLKLKRREQVVSSVFLWQHAVQDVQANAPFQKLRKNLLLFIQLGVLLLIVAALARPFARMAGLEGQSIVVVIDSSASMRSTDVGRSRFDEAKRLALRTADQMGRGDAMLVITAAAKTRVASSFTSDRKALAAAITALKPKDTRANLREAIGLALSLVSKKKNPRIVIISDGGFSPVSDIRTGKAKISFIKIGKRSDNVGIVAMDSRKTLDGAQQVFVGLRNFSDHKRDFQMEVYLKDQLIDIRDESLDKGASKEEILAGLPNAGGRLMVKLIVNDDLAADNAASVYLTVSKERSVLIVTKGNMFIERAFNLDPKTDVVKASAAPPDISGYDIAVFDGIKPPDDLPPGGYLLINTDCRAAPAHLSRTISRPEVVDSSKNHPAASYVDFSGLQIATAKTLTLTDWGQELVECQGGAIAAAGESSGRRFVVLGWNMLDSDFPLRVGFPIFVTNCIEWLGGGSESANMALHTSDVAAIDLEGEREVTVTDPNGQETHVRPTGSTAYFDGTETAGVYKMKIGRKAREFACNLLSPQESNTKPQPTLRVGERHVAQSLSSIRTNREFWRIILIIGLALLSFEWYAFHRRLG